MQLLRQLLDDKILCKLQKPFEMKTVEGLSIISAMSMSEQASVSSRQLSDRLLVSKHCRTVTDWLLNCQLVHTANISLTDYWSAITVHLSNVKNRNYNSSLYCHNVRQSRVQCKILKFLMVKSTDLVSLKIGHQKLKIIMKYF